MIFSLVFAALGVFCIFYGLRILLTGKLSKSEEAKISSYSNKGARAYKLINAVISIVIGLCIFVESIIQILEVQKMLADTFIFKAVIWGVIIAMIIVYFVVAVRCKKMTDE